MGLLVPFAVCVLLEFILEFYKYFSVSICSAQEGLDGSRRGVIFSARLVFEAPGSIPSTL